MNHTPEIKKAIQFSAKKHEGQLRKEAEAYPYFTHVLSAALIAAEGGASDDVVIATLLHDTIEDTDTALEEIVEIFGNHIAKLVEAVTEDKSLPWKERKEKYYEVLRKTSDDALIVSIADKIDNIESKLEALQKEPDFHKRWKRLPEDYIWYHGEAVKLAKNRLPDHPLTKRLVEAHEHEKAALS
jgi:(p)ppGpp synthase/HD superfamily hydrolase